MAIIINPQLTNPKQIAEAGERIYREKYQADFERDHIGKFAAIDVRTGKAYLGEGAVEALQTARSEAPNGAFHLIKVGAPGAFKFTRFC